MGPRAWCILSGLLLLSCHAGRPPALGSSGRIAPGELCDPKGPLGEILDGDLKPINVKDELSVEAASGRPVLVCMQINEALAGRVLDETTHAPIAGALITVNSWESLPPTDGLHEPRSVIHSQQVVTDAQGKWQLASASMWMGGLLVGGGLPFVKSSQCIQAEGYEPAVFDPWKRTDWATAPDLAAVMLKHKGKGPEGVSRACVSGK